MSINNIENTGTVDLWSASTLPWQTALPWTYPTFTRLNNIENS